MTDRGRDWQLELFEGPMSLTVRMTHQKLRVREFSLRSGDSLDLRIAYTEIRGPRVLLLSHNGPARQR